MRTNKLNSLFPCFNSLPAWLKTKWIFLTQGSIRTLSLTHCWVHNLKLTILKWSWKNGKKHGHLPKEEIVAKEHRRKKEGQAPIHIFKTESLCKQFNLLVRDIRPPLLCFFHISHFGFVMKQIQRSKWAKQASWIGQLISRCTPSVKALQPLLILVTTVTTSSGVLFSS